MLLLGSRLIDTPVMGLQTGGELARTKNPVIDPGTLDVVAYDLTGPLLGAKDLLLRMADARELSDIGFIVDSSDEFVTPDDVITLGELYRAKFNLINMRVRNERREKIGKVVDYTIDTTTFTVVQLTVKRPLLRSFNDTELLIHRSQIIEINDEAIVIHSEAKVPEHTRSTAPSSYVNPFRKTNPATENSDSN